MPNYNGIFPANYPYMTYPQQMQPQAPQMPQMPQQTPMQNDFRWVIGLAGAQASPTAPNTRIPFWDSESQTIYIKTTDATGRATIQTLDYTIRDNNNAQTYNPLQQNQGESFITRTEFQDTIADLRKSLVPHQEVGTNEQPTVSTAVQQ